MEPYVESLRCLECDAIMPFDVLEFDGHLEACCQFCGWCDDLYGLKNDAPFDAGGWD